MSRNQKELAGLSRLEYLQALVTEFQVTDSSDAKEQVLANLANFAYNPQNYEYLRQLKVLDLFLDMLTEENDNLVEFALGGLCNLCLDKINKDYILEAGGVSAVVNCLASANEETVLSAVTTLMYLSTSQSRQEITTLPVIECMLRFSLSNNRRLKNLATIFLEDYCSLFQVEQARNLTKHTAIGIPLPKDECSPGGSQQDPP
ncbi:PREDICTED: armadillo repeat-containing protein 7 [Thamnophis sirtalis]|uniref:Armadillo repeat-containing protein 7 n=1 Tax=Thamnophis sirtalis TaxID=35019 RepID=A0A6I9YQU7_9SAUR|nr:PREDICTED: armadillo repeat-containing protein 7 [Thamnophis sirtalis]XP_013926022.1 PREDICTED: armadillo repeat-containing protein 7 [Thamnophis sirtalis]XP_032067322.1 armadillo repeat-containing protein 7 [Thamnophis elegans]XP_032067323.1 armadillo repeat-containing protein 7 [Thamnophis elegans]